MSDTPRTDSVMTTCGSLHNERVVVRVEFARTLERELGVERAKVARLREALKRAMIVFGPYSNLECWKNARAALKDTDG